MRWIWGMGCAALLAGCASNDQAASGGAGGRSDGAAKAVSAVAGSNAASQEAQVPKLAYRYALAFLLPDARLAEAQNAHKALCDRLGPARCQLLALTRGDDAGHASDALLHLRVATADAAAFTDAAARQVAGAGGRTLSTNVTGEDVSKDMTDTAARIRQREILVTRLTEMLRTRNGTVGELVEAERSVAAAQEELDKARAWLTELRGRVAMAEVEIRYQPLAAAASGGALAAALGEAMQGSASLFVSGAELLLSLAIYLLPWAAVLGGGIALVLAVRRRWPAA